MGDESFTVVLTPVQMYAVLTGKTITAGEMLQNNWHGLPSVSSIRSLPRPVIQNKGHSQPWIDAHTHYRLPARNGPECWIPPSRPLSEANLNRIFGGIELIGSTFALAGGVVMILAPEPTLLSKPAGTILALHSADSMQAAIRQLYTGKRVTDFTQQSGTWAAKRMGASERSANLVGVVLDVAVPVGAGVAEGAARIVAIRAGRIITLDDALMGKTGKLSLQEIEGIGKRKKMTKVGSHILTDHVTNDHPRVMKRAESSLKKYSSAFPENSVASESTNYAFATRRADIRIYVLNPASDSLIGREYIVNMGKVVGYGYAKGSSVPEELSWVNLVVKKSNQPGQLFYIVTCYPIRKP